MLLDSTGVRMLGKVDDEIKRARARGRRRAVRAVAGRRELRDGADRGVRRRDARSRIEHRRLPRRRSRRRRRRAGARRPTPGARRGAARPLRGARAPRRDGPERRHRGAALRLVARRRRGDGAPTRTRSPRPAPRAPCERAAVRIGRPLGRPQALTARARRLPSLEPEDRRPASAPVRWRSLAAGGSRRSRSAAPCSRCWPCRRSVWAASPPRCCAPAPHSCCSALGVMCASMVLRAFSWYAILRAALPRARVKLSDAAQGTFIGVLMSSTLPARLGEPSRALVVARRTGRPRENLPVVLGHAGLPDAAQHRRSGDPRSDHVLLGGPVQRPPERAAVRGDRAGGAAGAGAALAGDPARRRLALRAGCTRCWTRRAARMARVRAGLAVFRQPTLGGIATVSQLSAWGLQMLSCYLLLDRSGPGQAGPASAPRPRCCSRST